MYKSHKNFLQLSSKILLYLVKRFFKDDCANRAAALTYATLLSIVPIMMISFWVLSWFPAFKGTGEVIQSFIIENFIANSADIINRYLEDFMHQLSHLTITNLAFLGIASILMFFNIVQAFDAIWRVKGFHYFGFQFTLSLLLLLLLPILFGIIILAENYLVSLPLISFLYTSSTIHILLLYGIPYVTTWTLFTFLNWIMPSSKVPFINAAIAGFITAILFEMTKFLFDIYLSYVPTYRLLYGALAIIPIFLVWVYLCWVMILLGAIICHSLTQGSLKPSSILNFQK